MNYLTQRNVSKLSLRLKCRLSSTKRNAAQLLAETVCNAALRRTPASKNYNYISSAYILLMLHYNKINICIDKRSDLTSTNH